MSDPPNAVSTLKDWDGGESKDHAHPLLAQWTEEKAMANTEITVSMGDMVVVKTTEEDDEEPDNGSKTQVILQLQPITHG